MEDGQPQQPPEQQVPPQQPVPQQPAAQPEQLRQAVPARPPIKFDSYQAKIVEMDTHHKGLWEFRYELDKPMDFKAGQYVSIYLPNMKPAPFSIASSPAERKKLSLGVEVVGQVTTAMSQMQPGDIVPMKGPFGNFTIGSERKVCFLAGGIGITPFISMMRWINDESPDKYAVLFYSCKAKDQFMWFDELESLHQNNANLKCVFTLTREQPEGWKYNTRRIDEQMIKDELPDFMEYIFFSCGPPTLIDAMFSLLTNMGVPQQNLKREAWH